MVRNWRRLAALSAIVATCGGGYWFATRGQQRQASIQNAGTSAIAWTKGTQYEYALSFETQVDRVGGEPFLHFDFKGPLRLTVMDVGPNGMTLHAALVPEAAKIGHGASGQDAAFRASLAEPFAFSLNEHGRGNRTRFASSTTSLAVNAWKSWLAAFQFSRGEGASWEAREMDAVGEFTASYRREPEASGRSVVTKLKSAYGVKPDVKFEPPKIVRSEVRYLLEESGALVDFEWNDETLAQLGPALGELSAKTRVHLERIAERRLSSDELDGLTASIAELPADMAAKPKPPEEAPIPDDLGVAPGLRLPELAARAAKAATTGDRHKAVRTLAALLRQKPEQVGIAAVRIAEEGNDAKALLDALGAAGSPAAQAALLDVAKDEKRSVELRKKAATTLIAVKTPTSQTAAALEGLLDDPEIGTEATLALGSVAGNLAATDPEASVATTEKLVTLAHDSKTDSERRRYLIALGNAGTEAALPTLREQLRSTRPQVRETTVFALRSIPGAEAEGLILSVIAGDADVSVRKEALHALSYRPLTSAVAEALAVAISEDADVGVRHQAILLSGKLNEVSPTLRAALERAATREEGRVATAAQKVLTQL